MSESNLCLFRMPDGSVECRSCDHPPANSVYLKPAPEGLEEGEYESSDPRLAGVMEPGEGT